MRFFFVLLVVVATAALDLDEVEQEWIAHKLKHDKHYEAEEEPFRRSLFFKTKQMVEEHNRKHAAGLVSYRLAVNYFADLTQEEIRPYYSCISGSDTFNGPSFVHERPENSTVPDEIDWRTKGAVTEVKDQGRCGSCWAFSTTGSLEGQHFLKKGELVRLSEQNLVDCDDSNNQCKGGWMSRAFQYIKENGIDTEASYPYESGDGVPRECRFNKDTVGATVSGIVRIFAGSEEDLQHAVATIGPVSVAIDAEHTDFHHYEGGYVYYNENCSTNELSHAVTVVGYGTQGGQDYWLVKNSWGKNWGEQGYIKMARNRNNHCGIATSALYPVV